jgi:hypothetical protein
MLALSASDRTATVPVTMPSGRLPSSVPSDGAPSGLNLDLAVPADDHPGGITAKVLDQGERAVQGAAL